MLESLFSPYTVLKWLHIITAGLWLGMDMGVFTASRRLRRADLSIETRAAMGKLAGILDMGPRCAVVIMLMLGITMTLLGGWGAAGAYSMELALTAALVGAVWLAGLWHQFWVDHPDLGEIRPEAHLRIGARFRSVDIAMRVAITTALAGVALWSLVGDGPIAATWLGIKLLLFSLIVVCGIGIRVCIPPTRAALAEIFASGSTPEREAALEATRGLAVSGC